MEQNELLIDLTSIVKSEGMEIQVNKEYPIEVFSEFSDMPSLQTPVTLTGTITNHAGNLFLKGDLSFRATFLCDRCLESFEKDFIITSEMIDFPFYLLHTAQHMPII